MILRGSLILFLTSNSIIMNKKKLKLALKKAGLDEGLADYISVENESDIAKIVNQLKGSVASDDDDPEISPDEFVKSKAFTDYLEENGFDKLLTLNTKLQSEHDKKVTQGIKSFKSKVMGDEGQEGTKPKKDDVPDEAPEWFKPFAKTLVDLSKEKEKSTKMTKAQDALSKSKLPKSIREKWASRIDPDSETSVDDQVKGLEEEYKSIHGNIIGDNSYEFPDTGEEGKSGGGTVNGKLSKSDAEDLKRQAAKL